APRTEPKAEPKTEPRTEPKAESKAESKTGPCRSQALKETGGTGPRTLGIDIGGTAIQASVLDTDGRMIVERVRQPTAYPCTPDVLLDAIAALVALLPAFDRISVGFPGVVRGGQVVTAPHFGKKAWRGFPLEAAVGRRLERPARLLNDAEVQGLGIVAGRGLEGGLQLGP